MKQTTVYAKFHQALPWNGLVFFVGKISKTLISCTLFSLLDAHDFALWANVLGVAYLLALWVDCGFRSSIPLFMPFFAKNRLVKMQFMRRIIAFKLFLSMVTMGIVLIVFNYVPPAWQIHTPFFYSGVLLFVTESMRSLLRLIFHSYFWQKQFNLLESCVITLQTIALLVLFLFFKATPSLLLLTAIFTEVGAHLFIIGISIAFMSSLTRDENYQENKPIDGKQLTRNFALHSGIMWGVFTINSLTERNFLVPFFSYILGPAAAGIFKVANDGALLFQRLVLKTIGTADTSLIAHVEAESPHKNNIAETVFILNKRIISLTVPLLGIVIGIASYLIHAHASIISTTKPLSGVATTFFLLSLLYLLQILFLGYDRVLEVKKCYSSIMLSCIPYLGIIGMFLQGIRNAKTLEEISLIDLCIFIHGIRLISVGIRAFFAHSYYKIHFPMKYAAMMTILSAGGTTIFYFVLLQISPFITKIITATLSQLF